MFVLTDICSESSATSSTQNSPRILPYLPTPSLNGFKIGKVNKINFNPKNTKELIVDIVIENDVIFPKSSKAELYETGLIGGKAIAIIPDYKNDSTFANDGDFLKGTVKPGLTELVNQILPQVQLQIEAVMKNAEFVLQNINNAKPSLCVDAQF